MEQWKYLELEVMVVKHCECTKCYWIVHFKIVNFFLILRLWKSIPLNNKIAQVLKKIVNFMCCELFLAKKYYHNNNQSMKLRSCYTFENNPVSSFKTCLLFLLSLFIRYCSLRGCFVLCYGCRHFHRGQKSHESFIWSPTSGQPVFFAVINYDVVNISEL